jgi:lipid II:glycine glycyltransferase (peptidoglycan interpeptide bridge formation enzyme)
MAPSCGEHGPTYTVSGRRQHRGKSILSTGPEGLYAPSASEWDAFVATRPGDVLAQTTLWARTKKPESDHLVLGVRRDGDLVGGAMVLLRRIGPLLVAHAPRGPILAPGHEDLAGTLVSGILDEVASWRPTAVILQPADLPEILEDSLGSHGFTVSPVDVTTPATVEVDLAPDPDALLAGMRSSRKRNIKRAERMGVEVRRGGEEDIELFHDLHGKTGGRQGFEPMSLSYLQRQWEVLGTAGMFHIYVAHLDGHPLSAATVTAFGDRAVFKLAGFADDDIAKEARASEYLHWKIMLDTRDLGYRFYDLGGFEREVAIAMGQGGEIPDELRSTASQFKLGFGGSVRALPEARWRVLPGPLRLAQGPTAALVRGFGPLESAVMRLRS